MEYIIIGLIIVIVLDIVAVKWFLRILNEQKSTNRMLEEEQRYHYQALLSLQKEFTDYQVSIQRDLDNIIKTSTKEINHLDRRINKTNSELPSKIKKIVGHIEFARPLDKK